MCTSRLCFLIYAFQFFVNLSQHTPLYFEEPPRIKAFPLFCHLSHILRLHFLLSIRSWFTWSTSFPFFAFIISLCMILAMRLQRFPLRSSRIAQPFPQ